MIASIWSETGFPTTGDWIALVIFTIIVLALLVAGGFIA